VRVPHVNVLVGKIATMPMICFTKTIDFCGPSANPGPFRTSRSTAISTHLQHQSASDIDDISIIVIAFPSSIHRL
jgi:hypothetical protein